MDARVGVTTGNRYRNGDEMADTSEEFDYSKTVVVPVEPPALSPFAAQRLLRLIRNVAAATSPDHNTASHAGHDNDYDTNRAA